MHGEPPGAMDYMRKLMEAQAEELTRIPPALHRRETETGFQAGRAGQESVFSQADWNFLESIGVKGP